METKNAKIKKTFLGFEGHGFLTYMIHLDYGGSGQAFGSFSFGVRDKKVDSPYGMEAIRRLLRVVDVDRWEDLPGKSVRVKATHSKVESIGNFLKDDWLDLGKLAEEMGK